MAKALRFSHFLIKNYANNQTPGFGIANSEEQVGILFFNSKCYTLMQTFVYQVTI